MLNFKNKKFTIGISFKKHLKQAKRTFNKEVLPQYEKQFKMKDT